MRLNIETLYNQNEIRQKVSKSVNPFLENEYELLCERVIKIQDEQIKQALINLGWTPPKERNNTGEVE